MERQAARIKTDVNIGTVYRNSTMERLKRRDVMVIWKDHPCRKEKIKLEKKNILEKLTCRFKKIGIKIGEFKSVTRNCKFK